MIEITTQSAFLLYLAVTLGAVIILWGLHAVRGRQ
jgi:hypothetical protein